MSLASLPAVAVAVLIPMGYLFWISQRDFFETRKQRLIQISFVWGLIAYFLAYQIQTYQIKNGLLGESDLIRYVAPVQEEILKGLVLLYLIRRADFTYFVDGAIYGFTVGVGFAVVENIEYVLAHPSSALILALMRVLSTNLIHATASGSIGIALGLSRFERSFSLGRAASLLVSALTAMGLHMAFNNIVSRDAPVLFAILAGMGGAFLVYVIMQRGLKIMKGWVDEQLNGEQSVTSREASIVRKFESVDEILEGFTARFGEPMGALARDILLAQAQMGIYKKTAEKHQDESMRLAAEQKVAELRQQMNENRRKLGAYRMLFLRNIFPEDASPLWGRLETILQARTVPRSQAGTGLWTTLTQRVSDAESKGGPK